jgi:hypothetical protein
MVMPAKLYLNYVPNHISRFPLILEAEESFPLMSRPGINIKKYPIFSGVLISIGC